MLIERQFRMLLCFFRPRSNCELRIQAIYLDRMRRDRGFSDAKVRHADQKKRLVPIAELGCGNSGQSTTSFLSDHDRPHVLPASRRLLPSPNIPFFRSWAFTRSGFIGNTSRSRSPLRIYWRANDRVYGAAAGNVTNLSAAVGI